ncbi:MAG: NAD kinase, partial [Bacteroidia bacterium]|nr:NAD kinase [Bacteroidia bacterium]
AVYGRSIRAKNFKKFFSVFSTCMANHNIEFEVVSTFNDFISKEYDLECVECSHKLSPSDYTCLISLGGDGTMLDTLELVKDSGLPVMGINLGRLGFLANIKMEEIEIAVEALKQNNVDIESRTVLTVQSSDKDLIKFPYALNDFVVQKRDTSAMITVKAHLNGDFLNNYWADGLIVSTPTGSSGYNLSCGGPLIFPGSQAFVITPIAAHNLTVRPAVVPDSTSLEINISSRSKHVLITLDSRSVKLPSNSSLVIKRADFQYKMIRLKGNTYMDTIRNKLLWGADARDK